MESQEPLVPTRDAPLPPIPEDIHDEGILDVDSYLTSFTTKIAVDNEKVTESVIELLNVDFRSTLALSINDGELTDKIRDIICNYCIGIESKGDKVIKIEHCNNDINLVLMHDYKINEAIKKFREVLSDICYEENKEYIEKKIVNMPDTLKIIDNFGELSIRTPSNIAVQAQFPIEYDDEGNFKVVYPEIDFKNF